MLDIITIQDVAQELGVSYFVARNRLSRHPKAKALKHKMGHTVVYEKKALKLLKDEDGCNQ